MKINFDYIEIISPSYGHRFLEHEVSASLKQNFAFEFQKAALSPRNFSDYRYTFSLSICLFLSE